MFLLSKGMELLENYLKLMLYNILFSNLVLALIPVCNSNKSINAKIKNKRKDCYVYNFYSKTYIKCLTCSL